MDLKLKNCRFIVGGAGSGFGKAIAEALSLEGCLVLAVSRTEQKLLELKKRFPRNIQLLTGDIGKDETQDQMLNWAAEGKLDGVVINAGGPPAGGFNDIGMAQWDQAWQTVVRWKIVLTGRLLPVFREQQYGRLVFIESVSVKQPVQNLILSNALRPAIVGFAKTLSREVAGQGITVNVLAPGYHATAAMERLFKKKSELQQISVEAAKAAFEAELSIRPMGKPAEMAGLALWLLSPLSRFVTGQTITHDGGMVEGIFG
ncbi:MAG: SDR family oxidoreductase [Bacteroidales bacterium]|nr:SDR family oxidoreductase [Bacteroidales bacterium]